MAEKTEQPTQKKLDDGAKKGQILKNKDVVVSLIMIFGIVYLCFNFSMMPLMDLLYDVIVNNYEINLHEYTLNMVREGLSLIFKFLGGVIVVIILVSFAYSKFRLATEALKLNLNAINPVNGIKKMFSWRTLKDFVKAFLYFVVFMLATWLFWTDNRQMFFIPLYADLHILIIVWVKIFFKLIIYCLVSLFGILILDVIAEYFLFMKDMKMEKEEVKREYKDQEGNPEVKSKRKEMHRELLSEQMMSDVNNSKLIVANPTHIAIGIYFKPEISPIPVVSIRETNQMALAVRDYAKKRGIPVIRDVKLARRLYATHKQYDYVSFDEIEKVFELLVWLEQVELAYRPQETEQKEEQDTQQFEDKEVAGEGSVVADTEGL